MSQPDMSTTNSVTTPPLPTPSRGAFTIRQILVERFPACFRPKGRIKLPLDRAAHMIVRQRHRIAYAEIENKAERLREPWHMALPR